MLNGTLDNLIRHLYPRALERVCVGGGGGAAKSSNQIGQYLKTATYCAILAMYRVVK